MGHINGCGPNSLRSSLHLKGYLKGGLGNSAREDELGNGYYDVWRIDVVDGWSNRPKPSTNPRSTGEVVSTSVRSQETSGPTPTHAALWMI